MTRLGGAINGLRRAVENIQGSNYDLATGGKVRITDTLRKRVGVRLRPFVMREMMRTYAESGLGKRTGALFKCMMASRVILTPKMRILIELPRGYPARVYKRAAAWQYGRISGTQGAKITGGLRKNLVAASSYKNFSGTRVVHPKAWFRLKAGSMARLNAVCEKLLREETAKGGD